MIIALRALLVAIVVAIPNGLHLPQAVVKGINPLNALVLLALAVLASMPRPVPAAPPAPLKGTIAALCAGFVYACAIGLAQDPSQWAGDLTALKNALLHPLLFFLFYHAIRDATTARVVFLALLGVTVLAALEAIREGLSYGSLTNYNDAKRAAGPFGPDYRASNLAAVFFCMFFPLFGAVVLFQRDRPLLRALALAGAVLIVFGTFFTFSRQALAILALTIALLAARRNLVLAGLALIALASYESWVPESVVARIDSTYVSDPLAVSEQRFDASTESRFVLWTAAWEMFRDHPAGVGLAHFKRHTGDYAPAFAGFDAHNFYLLFLAEGGVPGIVLLAAGLVGLAGFAWRAGRGAVSADAKVLTVGFQLSLLATLLGNLYGSRLLDGSVSGNLWLLAALVARRSLLDTVDPATVSAAHAPTGAPTGAARRGPARPGVAAAPARRGERTAPPAPPCGLPARDRHGRLLLRRDAGSR